MVNIQGLDKREVLIALYNAAKPLGLGWMHYTPEPMTLTEAEYLLNISANFDYLKGRVMKVNLSEDEFDPYLYDRDNGQGAAQGIIDILRATNND